MAIKSTKTPRKILFGLKMTVAVVLIGFAFIRLAQILYFTDTKILSDKILFYTALLIISYFWVQKIIEYRRVLEINKSLLKTQEQLRQAEFATISSLVKTEEASDLYTRGHSQRVTDVAVAIAEELNLDEEEKKAIARAGILHDIGKIGISRDILHKKGELTDEEWAPIKAHPLKAVEILEPLKFLDQEKKIILSHHERYDGKGYPQGLKGSEICFEASILSVADSFDSMRSKRPYRQPLDKENIITELLKSSGTQHAPEVVEALLRLLTKRPHLWEK
ncbi:MAG: HD-GYP domain-containing protein [Candidatus Omnitrophota bacterium]